MDYVEKLISYGFKRCCAETIVRDYVTNGKEKDLVDYILTKESLSASL